MCIDDKLLNKFVLVKPRETSGASSSNRFDYQKNWALLKLLELQKGNKNYEMVFEHHEDIVIFKDDPAGSKTADFYQVKSRKSGNWTISALTKNKKTNRDSIIGKLYDCYEKFSDDVNKLVFVSNQATSAKLYGEPKAETKDTHEFKKLDKTEKKKIQVATHDTSCEFSDIFGLNKLEFHKTILTLDEHSIVAKGKLLEFFELVHTDKHIHSGLAYKTIFDEIRRKSNYEKPCESVEQLLIHKAISRDQFDLYVRTITYHKSSEELWAEGNNILVHEGYPPLKVRRIKSCWHAYIVERMDSNNEPIQVLRQALQKGLSSLEKSEGSLSFSELIKKLSPTVADEAELCNYQDTKLEAAILYEVIANDPIQKVSEKPKEEKA